MMTNITTILNRDGIPIAYDYGAGNVPILVFLSGFGSDMTGTKAQFLKQQCVNHGQSYLLLDYAGHGQSGGVFEQGSIKTWCDDALDVIDGVLPPHAPLLVVGSSMGGWIALHVALKRASRACGLIGIASAPDFTRAIWNDGLDDDSRAQIKRDGVILEPSKYGGPVPITYTLLTDSDCMCLMDAPINLTIPITLIHGKMDDDVPWRVSEKLAQNLPFSAANMHFIPDGDHRLSRDQDLALLWSVVLDMLRKIS